jgi:Fic family protein
MVRYELPNRWILFDAARVQTALIEAKAAVQLLQTLPYQRSWVDKLQELQLKREVAGTSRIEGADFTEKELDEAVRPDANPAELITRSQRQAHSAMQAYRWIAALPVDRPVTSDLLREVHRQIVTGCDDDHCPPGLLRGRDHNVTFGVPIHRGVEGGPACDDAFAALLRAFRGEFQELDPLLQALALHYHLAAMHPFLDGNGRTARAAEALVFQRAGLTDRAFIAMSNYYYDEKPEYLRVLAETRAAGHNLTSFLLFGLRGIKRQCEILTAEIRRQMQKVLYRDTMYSLFGRLRTKRKRVIGERQIEILKILLSEDRIDPVEIYYRIRGLYASVKGSSNAFLRDLWGLNEINAIHLNFQFDPEHLNERTVAINLNWPQEIDESEFLRRMKTMPKGRTFTFLP